MKFSLLTDVNRNTENASLKEQFLVTVQLIVSVAFLISWLLNALLTYDLYLKKTGKEPIFEDAKATQISTYNQCYTLALIVIIAFINYQYIQVSRDKEDGDVNSAIGQFIVSIITLIAGTISLSILLRNLDKQFNQSDITNFEV